MIFLFKEVKISGSKGGIFRHFWRDQTWMLLVILRDFPCNTVDGSEIRNKHRLECVSNPVNNGINYQPQLVQDCSHQR